MLNFPIQNSEDKDLLQNSFNSLRSKDSLVIVSDPDEIDSVFKHAANSLSLPSNCAVSFANLFKIESPNGKFYIAQLFQDFGYSYNKHHLHDKYNYQVIGIAELTEDFGKIILRPESKADRLVGRIIKSDIEFPDVEDFNRQYYVAADKPDMALKLFRMSTLLILSNISDVTLKVNRTQFLITFEKEMNSQHAAMVEKILLSISVGYK